jgi:PknH-like extracellular domain
VNRVRWGAALAGAIVAIVTASGCATTVSGVAVRDAGAGRVDVPPLTAARLGDVLLSIGQLNAAVGATRMEVVLDGEKMSDNSKAVSDPDCLGSMFGAERLVYRSSGWTAVRDQVAREPEDDNDHWVEQTVVLHPTSEQAKAFVDAATGAWRKCSGFSVAVDDGTTSSIWVIDDVAFDADVATQVIAQEDSDGWECQHAMTTVSNVVVETIACAFGIHDEAVSIAEAIVAKAAG